MVLKKLGRVLNAFGLLRRNYYQSTVSSSVEVSSSSSSSPMIFSSTLIVPSSSLYNMSEASIEPSITSSSSSSSSSSFFQSTSMTLPGVTWGGSAPFFPNNEGTIIPLPLLAVPKRKHSYSRKRHRQSNPLYQEEVISHIYPCPKCSKGLLKMRHHICPCDQDKLGSNGVVRISSSGEKGSSS